MSRVNIFFFIDAMGAQVVQDQPVIRDLAENFRSLRSVFGYSSACVPSILTGRFPEEHLHWSYFTYSGPGTGLKVPSWLKIIPTFIRDRGRVRGKLSAPVARANRINGYFQMYMMPIDHLHHYGHCEPNDIFEPGGMNRGENIFDHLRRQGTACWISDWHRSPEENWRGLQEAAKDSSKTFLLIYDGAMDAWLHDHTRDSPRLAERLAVVRQQIDAVLSAARANHDDVIFHVFSDHGMSTIRETLDPFPILERSRLQMHRDYHCVVDSTMIRLWYPNDQAKRAVQGALEGVSGLSHLDDSFMVEERCAFPDNRFGDDFYLAEPHLLLVPSHLGNKPMAGMHGYSCDDEDSDASFLSNDAAAAPDCIVDLYQLMAAAASPPN